VGIARLMFALGALAAATLVLSPAAGQSAGGQLHGAELLAALRAGGFILYFRHSDTDHSQTDQSLDDCAHQRNLTDRGREHARAIGEAIRALAIPIGPVRASPMCRTVETAMLIFGTAERSPAAREAGPQPPGTPERYSALRALLSTPPPAGVNAVIVGHGYPFYSLVRGQVLEEGEAAIVRPGSGGFEVAARLGLKEWRELAGPPG
jgi:phosphohistidine phosphatase SixA